MNYSKAEIIKNTGFTGTNKKWLIKIENEIIITCRTKKECTDYLNFYKV